MMASADAARVSDYREQILANTTVWLQVKYNLHAGPSTPTNLHVITSRRAERVSPTIQAEVVLSETTVAGTTFYRLIESGEQTSTAAALADLLQRTEERVAFLNVARQLFPCWTGRFPACFNPT